MIAACSTPDAVLLSVTADAKAEQVDVYVRDDSTAQIIFHSGFSPVQLPSEKPRDITKDALKIALKLSRGGSFTLLLVGVMGDVQGSKPAPGSTQLFWAGRVNVDGTVNVSARLLTVMGDDDHDGDLWPDASDFLVHTPGALQIYKGHTDLLDCDDKIDNPPNNAGMPIKFKAADINPFAVPVCGIGYSVDCSAKGPEVCVDKDKDHDPEPDDCDDNDPKRHHATDIDPYPDPPNCCGYSLGKKGTADENTNFLCNKPGASPAPCYAANCNCDMVLCPAKRCGDGIDESCQGKDTTCVVDEDCDGYPAPPQGNDCDDHDPNVHPGAVEPCGSTKDLNCDGVIGGGCVPCDLDGDGYERNDKTNGCPDSKDKHPGMFDCNDYDSSVYPGATESCGGTEAGTGLGRLRCSLRGLCRRVYESTGMTGTPKVSSFGWLVGDADCNGVAYEGCPPPSCDADGDGWPVNNGTCAAVDGKFDCDDTNPTIYPGAPVSCGTGPAEDCTSQKMPCDNDADHDGWNAGADCDDSNADVHPWAPELCDGIDNDCDGDRDAMKNVTDFIDEGNPDVTGKPLVASGNVTTCTDSNVGECAKTLGRCVCSVASPMSTTNPQNRTFCPTEQTQGAMKPPRCFGAGQPQPQSCDADNPKDDDCDGRVDAPDGKNLAVKGMPCGISGPAPLGQCKAGLVTGCDMTQVNCFEAFMRIPTSQKWYVCSTDAVCPKTEVCNGLDDDCDGTLAGNPMSNPPLNMIPANDEFDHDGDGYMACTGCAGLMLSPTVMGCGDCDDTNRTIHPNAPELCDGLNNTCAPGWSLSPGSGSPLDGSGDPNCGAGFTCCSSQTTCFNLGSNFSHCGTCDAVAGKCNVIEANICDPTLHCACKGNSGWITAQCPQYHFCDPTQGSAGAGCPACGTNTNCGDSCMPCGPGQKCQAGATASGFTCGCTSDTGCSGGTPYCNLTNGSCQSTAPNGHACGGTVVCQSGNCVDGFCCDSACNGSGNACSACNVPLKEGTCSALAPGSTPYGTLGRTCNGTGAPCAGTCTGSRGCTYATSSTACGTASCNTTNNTFQPVGACDGGGSCSQPAFAPCPNGLICANTTSCKGSCGADTDCTQGGAGQYCNKSGACSTRKAAGNSCNYSTDCFGGTTCNECVAGFNNCVDGVCCNVSACGQCLNCQAALGNSNDGKCVVQVKSSTPGTGVDDTTPTTCSAAANGMQCDINGVCKGDNGTACNPANGGTDCLSGFCASNGAGGNVCCNQACPAPSSSNCVQTSCAGGTCGVKSAGATCGSHFQCDGSSSACPVSCSNNNQCATGSCCNNDAMRTCGVIGSDTACGNGTTTCADCTLNSNGQIHCYNGLNCGCTSDSDCGSTQYCDTTTTHTCQACGLGAPCGGHCATNCGSGNYCNSGNSTCTACGVGAPCGTGGGANGCGTNCGSGNWCQSNSTCRSCTATLGGPCNGISDACHSGCGTANYCNAGLNQCTSCGATAPCNGSGINNCGGTCATGFWCDTVASLNQCSSCSTVEGGPCGASAACNGACGSSATGFYCNPTTSTCRSCVTFGNDTHCGACNVDCTGSGKWCNNSELCLTPSPNPSPCAQASCAPGANGQCAQCTAGACPAGSNQVCP